MFEITLHVAFQFFSFNDPAYILAFHLFNIGDEGNKRLKIHSLVHFKIAFDRTEENSFTQEVNLYTGSQNVENCSDMQ